LGRRITKFTRLAVAMASAIWFGFNWNLVWANPAPPPLSVYGALPKTEDLALSPNGKRVALINTVDDQRIVTVSEVDGVELVRAAAGDLKIAGLHWADDDHLVVYVHRTARLGFYFEEAEFLQGIVVQPSTKHVAPLVPSSSYMCRQFLAGMASHRSMAIDTDTSGRSHPIDLPTPTTQSEFISRATRTSAGSTSTAAK
jgi:hypothetical protein